MIQHLLNPAGLLLVVALLAAPVAALAGLWRPSWAGTVGTGMAGLAFGLAAWGWRAGGDRIDVAWAPTWDLRLSFALDGLAVLYALLATGIGALVLIYASWYVPLHLEHQHRPQTNEVRFHAFLLLFMGAMVGLVMAQDLVLIFVFWDLTAIASYYLIGFDRHEAEARASALMAMLVTGISAVCLLIGALLLYADYGTFALPELIARAESSRSVTTAGALMAVAALAKSAQAPLHFWLPRAMAAPTPVSAYLHSAAMVAAGVFLLGRLYPLLAWSDLLLDGLLAIGFLSMAVGGLLALTREELKQVLAYSTISQYGYVVVMLGLGGIYGTAGATFYVVAHALAKSALFLTAGAVTEATGEKRLAALGGLWRRMPLLAAASAAAAAGLAALPLTVGFFKDELFFVAALKRGPVFAALALVGAALSLAYIGRFWIGIFLGKPRVEARPIPTALVAPVVVLGVLVVAGGIVVEPVTDLAAAAGAVTYGSPTPIHPAYHLDARPENLLAVGAWALGAFLLAARPVWVGAALTVARLGERIGPARGYRLLLFGLNRFSDRIHAIEVRDLRSRVATVLVPAALLVGAGVLVTPTRNQFVAGGIQGSDLPLLLVLLLTAIAGVATCVPRDHLSMALVLSSVGYCLAVAYAFSGAPDVALVAVLIETIFALLFLGVLALLPRQVLRYETFRPVEGRRGPRDALLAVITGAFAFVVVWGVLSRPSPRQSVIVEQAELTPAAHGKDIVTVILADFRGLDTMGEITVVAIAMVGLAGLLQRGRLR